MSMSKYYYNKDYFKKNEFAEKPVQSVMTVSGERN